MEKMKGNGPMSRLLFEDLEERAMGNRFYSIQEQT